MKKRDQIYINKQVTRAQEKIDHLENRLRKLWKGVEVIIRCPNYNGQVSGTSRPKLLGKTLKVDNVHIYKGEVILYFADHPGGIKDSLIELAGEQV